MSCGVIASAGGAAARAGAANTVPNAAALAPFRTSRRETARLETKCLFIARSPLPYSPAQRAAALGRQRQMHLAAFGHDIARRRHHTQRRAVGGFDQVVTACAEEHLSRDARLDH